MQQGLAKAQLELRDSRLEIERQREQIKGRDTHIAELRAKVEARDETIAALEAELQELRAKPPQQLAANAAPAQDDLTRIRGVGPGYARSLREAGITSFASIASWTDDDLTRIAELLNTHKSRIERSKWIEQASAFAQESAASDA